MVNYKKVENEAEAYRLAKNEVDSMEGFGAFSSLYYFRVLFRLKQDILRRGKIQLSRRS